MKWGSLMDSYSWTCHGLEKKTYIHHHCVNTAKKIWQEKLVIGTDMTQKEREGESGKSLLTFIVKQGHGWVGGANTLHRNFTILLNEEHIYIKIVLARTLYIHLTYQIHFTYQILSKHFYKSVFTTQHQQKSYNYKITTPNPPSISLINFLNFSMTAPYPSVIIIFIHKHTII